MFCERVLVSIIWRVSSRKAILIIIITISIYYTAIRRTRARRHVIPRCFVVGRVLQISRNVNGGGLTTYAVSTIHTPTAFMRCRAKFEVRITSPVLEFSSERFECAASAVRYEVYTRSNVRERR